MQIVHWNYEECLSQADVEHGVDTSVSVASNSLPDKK